MSTKRKQRKQFFKKLQKLMKENNVSLETRDGRLKAHFHGENGGVITEDMAAGFYHSSIMELSE